MKGWLPHSAISRRPAQIFPQIAVGQNRFCGLSALHIFLLAFIQYACISTSAGMCRASLSFRIIARLNFLLPESISDLRER